MRYKTSEVELEKEYDLKILNQYISKDVNIFAAYLKNNNRFIDFITQFLSFSPIDFKSDEDIYDKVKKYIYKNKKNDEFDKSTFEKILFKYYSDKACDLDLWDASETKFYINNQAYSNEYGFQNESELYNAENEKDKAILFYYNLEVQKKYIAPLLESLYPFIKWTSKKDTFDHKNIMKNFYLEVSKNSFKMAMKNFNDKEDEFLNLYLSENLHDDFHYYSKEVISLIESWYDFLFIGSGNIFQNNSYKQGAEKSWIPLLIKSNINITNRSVATSLVIALEQYMYIYALHNTLIVNNKSNFIIGKDFKFISSISPILDFIYKTMKLTKAEFRYIFFTLLREKCHANNTEIKFLIPKLEGLKKETFLKNEPFLPIIKKTICPVPHF